MKKIGLLIGLALVGVIAYFLLYSKRSKPHGDEVKEPAATMSPYSSGFTDSVKNMMEGYYTLSEAFVNWDSAAVTKQASALSQHANKLNLDELRKDTVIFETASSYLTNLKAELDNITKAEDLAKKRLSFHTSSQNIYDLLRTVQYAGETVYFQECPMAFNDTEAASWLSRHAEIRNPYLGLHHPKYRGGMLECGETKDSLHVNGQVRGK